MSQFILFLVLGLSVGAVYAALTMGIVVTYQGTGVINFAAAAMATVPLYVYDELKHGRVSLPLPWANLKTWSIQAPFTETRFRPRLPGPRWFPSFHVGNAPTWLAVLLALVVAAGLGALVQVLVSRPLRTAPVLAKVVAAVGIMLTLQAALSLKYGTDARPTHAIMPTGSVKIGGATIPVDRLWLIGLVVVTGLVLALWFRR